MSEEAPSPPDGHQPSLALALRGWIRPAVAAAGGVMLAVGTAGMLWRQLDGVAVLGAVVVGAVLLLVAAAGQIPGTIWTSFGQQARVEVSRLAQLRSEGERSLAMQSLQLAVAQVSPTCYSEFSVMPAQDDFGQGDFVWDAVYWEPGETVDSPDHQHRYMTDVMYVPERQSLADLIPRPVLTLLRDHFGDGQTSLLLICPDESEARERRSELEALLRTAGFSPAKAPLELSESFAVITAGADFLTLIEAVKALRYHHAPETMVDQPIAAEAMLYRRPGT